MAELIVTSYGNGILAALREGNRVTELHVDRQKKVRVGNVYIGKVQNIAKNINAAFVDFGCGINGYLALDSQYSFTYTRQAKPGKCTNGDEIVVQVEREAVKTKLPVLTGNINLAGKYGVVVSGQKGISFSRKIHKPKFEKAMKTLLENEAVSDVTASSSVSGSASASVSENAADNFAVIIRTNAASVAPEIVASEILRLKNKCSELLHNAAYRTSFSCLYTEEHPFLELIRDYPVGQELKVVTDLKDFYDDVKDRLPETDITLHEDEKLSLTAIYSLKTAMDRALSKKVYLKSGGDMVLEPTEALTVIDVNTGKCQDKMSKENHLFRTNMEAATEIALQLRLRNYSGMILVDFIDMEEEEHDEKLLEHLKAELAKDRIKTTFVDMTGLHLAEITRKRQFKPLHEAVRELSEQ